MITAKVGNLLESIEEFKLDAIVNAANGTGPMGRGIAGAIKAAGGIEIQQDAFRVCDMMNPQAGDAYTTIPGTLPVKKIIHAVTMKKPGGPTDISIVHKAFLAALTACTKRKLRRIGCTALGTGVGGLNKQDVALIMLQAATAQTYCSIFFIDTNEEFIEAIHDYLDLHPKFRDVDTEGETSE